MNSSICPSGLVCDFGQPPSNAECGSADAGPSLMRCGVAERQEGERALVEGFGKPEFAFNVTGDPPSQILTWEPPEGARRVVCAQFTCLPEFQDRGIVTLDRCVVGLRSFPETQREVAISKLDALSPPEDASGGITPSSRGYLIERNVVGCWAYDGFSVIGATRLEAVSTVGTRAQGLIVDTCAGNDGKACALTSGGPLFGTCREGECRSRCTSNLDCERALPPLEVESGTADTDAATPPSAAGKCRSECVGFVDGASGRPGTCRALDAAP